MFTFLDNISTRINKIVTIAKEAAAITHAAKIDIPVIAPKTAAATLPKPERHDAEELFYLAAVRYKQYGGEVPQKDKYGDFSKVGLEHHVRLAMSNAHKYLSGDWLSRFIKQSASELAGTLCNTVSRYLYLLWTVPGFNISFADYYLQAIADDCFDMTKRSFNYHDKPGPLIDRYTPHCGEISHRDVSFEQGIKLFKAAGIDAALVRREKPIPKPPFVSGHTFMVIKGGDDVIMVDTGYAGYTGKPLQARTDCSKLKFIYWYA